MLYVVPKVEDIISATAIQYLIEDRVWIRKSGTNEDVVTECYRFYTVTFNPVTKECSCDCRKFEKDGILCRHVIRVWDQNKVKDIPPKYVISRWRKDVIRRHTRVKVAYHDPSQTEECKRYNTLLPDLESLCEEASTVNDDTVEIVQAAVKKLREEVRASRAKLVENTALPTFEIGSSLPVPQPATTPSSNPTHQSTPQAFTPRSTLSHQSTPQAITPRSTHQASPHAVTPNTGCARPNPNISKGSTTNNDGVKDPIIKKKLRGRPKGSRNKTLAELGYNTTKPNTRKDCDNKGQSVEPRPSSSNVKTKLPVKRKKGHNPYAEFWNVSTEVQVSCEELPL
ncbi:protein FAR1-RELATED SEQUENCE 4-like [Chenopodium quinoa]|uniref:protein FAR1-RELATED SEQUENCE 4-like n=1 Tax=Chenopodium quinoa TaxID=63459 RepID=UPI000B795544|nr:protein FAR1-RELATED SEQUENCE 4-like [Chenopodium quinoa]